MIMDISILRNDLQTYYREISKANAESLRQKFFALLDAFDAAHPGQSPYELKAAQYDCIADNITPILFDGVPFYFENGALDSYCDGCCTRGALYANGWLNVRNGHIFRDLDPHAYEIFNRNKAEQLYLTCGPYVDMEHFQMPKKIFRIGLRGIFEEAEAQLPLCETDEERGFIRCALTGLRAVRRMAEKFAAAAEFRLASETYMSRRECLTRIRRTAERAPWEPPETFCEGVCTLTFLRKTFGALDGVGFNSFGRVDRLLLDGYLHDIAAGISEDALYDDVRVFMLMWDCHFDRRRVMAGYADYEYEN